MKNLDLNSYGGQEMNAEEMKEVVGEVIYFKNSLTKPFLILILLFLSFKIFAEQSDSLKNFSCNSKATVYIVQNNIGLFSKNEFYYNNHYIGRLGSSDILKFECDEGKQIFWCTYGKKSFIEFETHKGKTYFIYTTLKYGLWRNYVELNVADSDNIFYSELNKKIKKRKCKVMNESEIAKIDSNKSDFIANTLIKYHKKQEDHKIIKQASTDLLVSIKKETKNNDIVIDYTAVDFPFSKKSISLSGFGGILSNPSMTQSLNISTSLNNLTREGLYRMAQKKLFIKTNYLALSALTDLITFLPMPLTSGWMHEEFHRAVFAKHGIGSYNDMNDFPITKTLVNVSHITDKDLIRLKSESPQDMVRLSEAGIEGQYLMSNNINKEAFFSNTKSITFTPLLNNLNSTLYVLLCSNKIFSDNATNDANNSEGSNIAKRDAVGMDFLSYTYDLFRPNEPYMNRGTHPSGVGINRYIKLSQLTQQEKSYLLGQGCLQLINLLNPISVMMTSFNLGTEKDGTVTRGNLYLNHWLTSFGYDISATGLLQYHTNNYSFTLHDFVNKNRWMPGIEAETYQYLIGKRTMKNPIPINARAMLWLQPDNLLFNDNKVQPGGMFETKVYIPLSKLIQPYISLTAKTKGWVAGNVYQEANISSSFGLRASF